MSANECEKAKMLLSQCLKGSQSACSAFVERVYPMCKVER